MWKLIEGTRVSILFEKKLLIKVTQGLQFILEEKDNLGVLEDDFFSKNTSIFTLIAPFLLSMQHRSNFLFLSQIDQDIEEHETL